jgi:hypothetical protein
LLHHSAVAETAGNVIIAMQLEEKPLGLRRHPRAPLGARVEVSWQAPNGEICYAPGLCLESSDSGFRFEVIKSIPIGVSLSIFIHKPNWRGSGSVRHCRRQGMKFHIGVELAAGRQVTSG